MRTTLEVSLWALLTASQASAFPGILNELGTPSIPDKVIRDLSARAASASASSAAAPTFDAASQLVSVSGIHEFKPPGPLDVRGPCPGLNALANHGYISRTGLVTVPEFVAGTKAAYNMAGDLSTILAVYGAAIDGEGAAWTIGGGPVHLGIGGSHGNYETDNSPMRGDLYQYGNSEDLVMSQFRTLYDLQPDAKTANYDLDVLGKFRSIRFDESVAKNPYFYYAPFSGTAVAQAAFVFIYRFMANHSAEYPDGRLDKETLKSFFSIHGPENNLTWVRGHERIPDNWYRRNDADAYHLPDLGSDIRYLGSLDPRVVQPGCNQGKVNTFVEIDTTNMTSGSYGPVQVLEDPLCFGLAWAQANVLKLGVASGVVTSAFLPLQDTLKCITIPSINSSVGASCPGHTFYGGPTAKVVPGAIQN